MICRLVPPLILPAAAAILLGAASSPARAASFDCTAARTALETAICADAGLSQADDAMAKVYRAQIAVAPAEFRDRLRASQRSWLAYVGPFCSIPADDRLQCLRERFKERAEELKQSTRQVGPLTFFRAATYAVGFNPERADRAFTHKTDFLQITAPQGTAARRWNRVAIDGLKDAAEMAETQDDLEISVRLSGASADLVSARFGTSWYSGSMAHPQYSSQAVVWSLRLGRRLTLADVFEDAGAGKDQLARRAVVHFEGIKDGVTRAAIRETLDEDRVWEITPKGLLLAYDPYAFGCYPCTGHALVPWAELAAYLRPSLPFVVKDLKD